MSDGLFAELFVGGAVREATSDRAWIQAMLDFEAALAAAEAKAGIVPPGAAAAIAAACDAARFDAAALGAEGRGTGNPAAPLVRALTDAVGGEAAGYVHWGATSQDAVDTAAMLIAHRAGAAIVDELDRAAASCARLADEHRRTVMAARTLLQQALPTTFGLKAAGWLAALMPARRRLAGLRPPVQLGGAAGTLAALGPRALDVLRDLAEELGLAEPVAPWHTARGPVGDVGAALAIAAGALAKVALDVELLAQTEVGEVAEPDGERRGSSSTLPHKRNPVSSTVAIACARRVQGEASILLAAASQEHERAAGAWQAEWAALTDALAYTGGAAAAMREVLDGLEVDPARMRHNLEATDGLILAEAVTTAMAARIGRGVAHEIVGAAARRAGGGHSSFRAELVDDPGIRAQLSVEEIDRALDPERYLGSADALVDRVLADWRRAA